MNDSIARLQILNSQYSNNVDSITELLSEEVEAQMEATTVEAYQIIKRMLHKEHLKFRIDVIGRFHTSVYDNEDYEARKTWLVAISLYVKDLFIESGN